MLVSFCYPMNLIYVLASIYLWIYAADVVDAFAIREYEMHRWLTYPTRGTSSSLTNSDAARTWRSAWPLRLAAESSGG